MKHRHCQKVAVLKLSLLLVILILITAACLRSDKTEHVDAHELLNAPMSVPEFIVATKPEPSGKLKNAEVICFGIDEGSIWIPGYDTEGISDHIVSNLTLTIDSSVYVPSDLTTAQPYIVIDRFDSDGEYIGWHGPTVSVCLESYSLSLGLHVATIHTASTKGEELTYSWAFEAIESN